MLYPPIEPDHVEWLRRGRHQIYVERSGSPKGLPVLFLHGGPGSGSSPDHRRFFHPKRYRIVLFDQRGCGRSEPLGETEENTTWHLVEDIEAIRRRLGISSWLLFGGSWGATLALCYAHSFPERLLGLILRAPFLARERDWSWFIGEGPSRLFPELHDRLSPLLRDRNAAHRALQRGRGGEAIARALWIWETALIRRRLPKEIPFPERERLLARAQIFYHYAAHRFFVEEEQVLRACGKIGHLPVVLIHGREDLICPVESSYELSRRLPRSRLEIIEGAGHTAFEPAMVRALVRATDRFAHLL